MKWCCDAMEARFNNRHGDGDFVVAGAHPKLNGSVFWHGFRPVPAIQQPRLVEALRATSVAGPTNIKLQVAGAIRYCPWCGAHLESHYGSDGGLLKDAECVKEIGGAT
jgi:hypothetical protein